MTSPPVRDPIADHLARRVALAVELQRDWAREEAVADVIEILLTQRLLKA
jgi:hypothetical protein